MFNILPTFCYIRTKASPTLFLLCHYESISIKVESKNTFYLTVGELNLESLGVWTYGLWASVCPLIPGAEMLQATSE